MRARYAKKRTLVDIYTNSASPGEYVAGVTLCGHGEKASLLKYMSNEYDYARMTMNMTIHRITALNEIRACSFHACSFGKTARMYTDNSVAFCSVCFR